MLKITCNSSRYEKKNIENSFESLLKIIDECGDSQEEFQPHLVQDILIIRIMIGNAALSVDQSRTQMAIWAISAAPLLMSHRLKYIEPELKRILLNKLVVCDLNRIINIFIIFFH